MACTLDNGMLYYDTKVFISNFEDFCVFFIAITFPLQAI
jgi:hypothetical protein